MSWAWWLSKGLPCAILVAFICWFASCVVVWFGWIGEKAKPEPNPTYTPDWQPWHSEWTTRFMCHCGHVYDGVPFSWTVCPNCGCSDLFNGEAGRTEWEVDLNFYSAEHRAVYGIPMQFFPDANKRNHHWVPKPEGCQNPEAKP